MKSVSCRILVVVRQSFAALNDREPDAVKSSCVIGVPNVELLVSLSTLLVSTSTSGTTQRL